MHGYSQQINGFVCKAAQGNTNTWQKKVYGIQKNNLLMYYITKSIENKRSQNFFFCKQIWIKI